MSWLHPIRTLRRRQATSRPFPAAWDEILARNVPLAARLSEVDRADLRRRIRIFVGEKRWEGAGSLQMTDEVRVTVAAGACLLLLHRDEDYYGALAAIVVYPGAFRVHSREHSADGLVTETQPGAVGRGVDRGGGCPLVGRRAPVIDRGSRGSQRGPARVRAPARHGRPRRERRTGPRARQPVSRVGRGPRTRIRAVAGGRGCARAHPARLVRGGEPGRVLRGRHRDLLRASVALRERHPELYAQLRGFYAQDPAAWSSASRAMPGRRSS